MGTNISINCLSTLGCPMPEFIILLNYSLAEGPLLPLNSSTVQLQLQDFRLPYGTVTCLARCRNNGRLLVVCGTQVLAGCESCPSVCPPPDYGVSVIFVKRQGGRGGCSSLGFALLGGAHALCLTLSPQTLQTPPAT